jgi:hypothetical protein
MQNIAGLWGLLINHQLGELRNQNCHIARLLPILEEVLRIITTFDTISFSHIYREQNKMVDRLSKEASQLEYGRWHITEHTTEGQF